MELFLNIVGNTKFEKLKVTMDLNVKTARAIVFDIRRARANDGKFISSAEVFYFRMCWPFVYTSIIFRLYMKFHSLLMLVRQITLPT